MALVLPVIDDGILPIYFVYSAARNLPSMARKMT